MSYPNDRRYTKDHEWARLEGEHVVIGITQYAQESLGDIVFAELPKVGAALTAGQTFGVVESTKAVSDLFAPVSGTVVASNDAVVSAPDTVNSDPHGAAWMVKVKPTNAGELDGLMTADQYAHYLTESGH
jgi:glycine cleavage system H protein